MDLRTIKTFKTIVACGSFQEAAEELNYAQSTVTTQIKKLESDLGVILLDRGNNLELTEAGKILNEKGELLLKSFENLRQSMTEFVEGDAGVINLGVMEPMASYRLPAILTLFAEQFPEVHINLQIHGSKMLEDMVMKGEVDLAISAVVDLNSRARFEPLFHEEVVLLTPKHHELNELETVCLTDLEDEKLVITNTACPFRANFEGRMMASGVIPTYEMEVSNLLTLKYYVQAGFGAAIVPFIAVNPAPEGTVTKRITDFHKGLTVGIVRRDESPVARPLESLLTLIKTCIETST